MSLGPIHIGALTLLAIWIVQVIRSRQRESKIAHQQGCRPPNKYPHSFPWGLDLFRARMLAVKEGRYNKLFQDHFTQYGKTWEERTFGIRSINTMETANIQTVMGVKFGDYGKLMDRNKAIMPFLGRGIWSEDGAAWRQTRDMVNPLFSKAELSDVDRFEKFVDRFLALVPRDGRTVDLQPLLQKLVSIGLTN